jgi:putative spermidine/putrescine transport system ATP-binding protein
MSGRTRGACPTAHDQQTGNRLTAHDPRRLLPEGLAPFRQRARRRRVDLDDRAGRVLRHARAVRLRQDHLPAPHRRLRAADSGSSRSSARRAEGVPPYRRNVNTVFQDYALFPHLNVLDNVAYGLMVKGVGKARAHKAAEEALAGAAARLWRPQARPAFRRPAAARGARPGAGQQAKGAAARRAARRARPQAAREHAGGAEELQKALGITFVFVTHDQGEALSMADRVAVFNDGKIMQDRHAEDIYQRPKTRFVADFVGSSNVLPPDFVQRSPASSAGAACAPRPSASPRDASGESARLVENASLSRRHHPLALAAEGLRLHVMRAGGREPCPRSAPGVASPGSRSTCTTWTSRMTALALNPTATAPHRSCPAAAAFFGALSDAFWRSRSCCCS